MSISNDLDEVSACIVCTKCKVNSPKIGLSFVMKLQENLK